MKATKGTNRSQDTIPRVIQGAGQGMQKAEELGECRAEGELCLRLMCQPLTAPATESPGSAALRGRRQKLVTPELTPPEHSPFAL